MSEQKPYGYNGRILHIHLDTGSTETEEMGEKWYRIYAGGGMLGTYFLLRDTPAGIDALSPDNLLIFASSVIAGQNGPGLARFSVVAKSPLSGGVAETRCEGPWGQYLKGSGYDALIFHGRAEKPVYALLENGRLSLCGAEGLWGKNTLETAELLRGEHPGDVSVAAIGQAGENLVRFASIVTDGAVQAMRMGVGAVMGSKNLKAVALCGKNLPPVAEPEELRAISDSFLRRMEKNQLSMWQKDPPGFSASADLSDYETAYIGENNYRGDLVVKNSDYSREKYLAYYKGCLECPGCPNDCMKYIDPGMGFPKASCIHQEITGSMGPNIGNRDLKLMLETNVLCNLYGMDPVSLGFTISFAMECAENGLLTEKDTGGLNLKFGSCGGLTDLVRDIAERRGFGSVLAEGSRRAAAEIGRGAERYALQVKGIEMVSFEPRTQTNLALGYATAPIGPRYDICEHDWDFDTVTGWDHTLKFSRTLGILERIPMQLAAPEKARNFKELNNLWSACDAMDLCIFASAPTRLLDLPAIAGILGAVTGWETSSYEFMRIGERRNQLMRVYNLREGLAAKDDTLPDRFFEEPIRSGRLKGTVLDRGAFSQEIAAYYEMMGWDAGGIPRDGTLYDYHLEWLLPVVQAVRKGGPSR